MDKRKISNPQMARLAGFLAGGDENSPAPVLPRMVGRYRVMRLVGEGASARVYEAEDLQLGRRVAVKLLTEGASDAFIRRFHREASLAAKLRHPNIVTIHEISMMRRPDGSPAHFIVMDFFERALDLALEKGEFSLKRRLEILEQVARAVHHAHEQGVIHRDLKPANILLDGEGRPALSDFGLAREETAGTRLTRSGTPVGTPSYMSPEQAAGKSRQIGPASDIYSLGVILYELITNRLPFGGDSVATVYAAILSSEAPKPRTVAPDVPRDLETICLKAMEREPARRFSSARAMADDLRRYLEGRPVEARREGTISVAVRKARRHAVSVVAVLVALAAIVGGWVVWRNSKEELARADRERQRLQREREAEARAREEEARKVRDREEAERRESGKRARVAELLRDARYRIEQEDTGAALKALDALLEIDPRHVDALYEPAKIDQAEDRMEAAAEGWRRILEIDPRHYQAAGLLGDYYHIHAKDNSKARPCYEAAIAANPKGWDPLHMLGHVAMEEGKYEEALKLFERALAELDNSEFYGDRSSARLWIFREGGRKDGGLLVRAMDDAERACKDSATWKSLLHRAEARAEMGRFAEAQADLESAYRLLKPAADSHFVRYLELVKKGERFEWKW